MSSNYHDAERIILIKVNPHKVDAMKDGLFCKNSDEWYEENWGYMASIWKKVATEFDYEIENRGEKMVKLLKEITGETVSPKWICDKITEMIKLMEEL